MAKSVLPFSCVKRNSLQALLAFAVEVEGFLDFGLGGSLVDADVADGAQKGEVDGVAFVLLVVVHQLQQAGVVVAGDGHAPVVLENEADGGSHLVGREACLDAAEVQFYHQSPRYGIAVEHGLALQGQRLEGMTGGVSQGEGLAQSLLRGVLSDDALLDGDATLNACNWQLTIDN